jgi:hypothetical protein
MKLFKKKIKSEFKIYPFPNFNDAFIEHDKLERYVFLPLVSIEFNSHKLFGNRTFYFISLWDTGSYDDDFLNNYRLDNYIIRFKYTDNKYSYPIKPNFPYISQLDSAFNLIQQKFDESIDYLLIPKNQDKFELEDNFLSSGGDFLHGVLPDLPRWEAGYYFERIIQYLYTKLKYSKFGKVYPSFTYSMTFVRNQDDEEKMKAKFHTFGKLKEELIKNINENPNWIQRDETPEGDDIIFIGSVSEYDFTNGTAEIYLFWDKRNEFVYQIFQWT